MVSKPWGLQRQTLEIQVEPAEMMLLASNADCICHQIEVKESVGNKNLRCKNGNKFGRRHFVTIYTLAQQQKYHQIAVSKKINFTQ